MSDSTIKSQFVAASIAAGLYHGLLNTEISKESQCMDRLFEYADKLREAVSLMRILDGIMERQAAADALSVPFGRG